ncbi:MAG: hypothetical protein KC656_32010 [Myxococcales bacterium]|nr:hypothetical protein [Myxococcales bacterium]
MKLNSYQLVALAGLAIVLTGGAFVVYDVLTGGGDHRPATYVPTQVERLTVCPSARRHLASMERAADGWATHHPECPELAIGVGDCLGYPEAGEVQVRSCFDALDLGGVRGCPPEHWDVVVVDRSTWSGAAYIAIDAPDDVHPHVYGHALGVGVTTEAGDGHATRATSIMAREPGSSWHGFGCPGE